MHVKISDTGRLLLNNRILAGRILETIITRKQDLEKGVTLVVKDDGKEASVKLVTTVKDCPQK